jgi:hypothetical protein
MKPLLILLLGTPHPPPSSAGGSGDFGEDCLSTQCEFRSRLTGRAHAGNPEGMADWGRLFFGYFHLAKQKKVTSCRATPDGVDVDAVKNKSTAQSACRQQILEPGIDLQN